MPLPKGTYYLDYEIEDVFMRRMMLDRIEIQYDGQNMRFPNSGTWEDGKEISLSKRAKR